MKKSSLVAWAATLSIVVVPLLLAPGCTVTKGGFPDGGAPSDGGSHTDGGTGNEGQPLTFQDIGFDHPVTAAGSDGTIHLLYEAGFSPPSIVYGECASGCQTAANWHLLTLHTGGPDALSAQRMTVAPNGKVQVIWEEEDDNAFHAWTYAECDSGCTQATGWHTLDLTSVIGAGTATPLLGSPMVVDANGQLSLITSTLSTDAPHFLATCASNCLSLGSWTIGNFRTGGIRDSLTVSGTTLHGFFNDENGHLRYQTCASHCTDGASWTFSNALFAQNGDPFITGSSISATSDGALHLVYNQGNANSDEPSNVLAQDRKLLHWACISNCTSAASWAGAVLSTEVDGDEGATVLATSEGVAILSETAEQLILRTCDGTCASNPQFSATALDSSELLASAFDPFGVVGCQVSGSTQGTRPISAAWYPARPALALTSGGHGIFVHAPYILRQCSISSDETRLPGYGRLVSNF